MKHRLEEFGFRDDTQVVHDGLYVADGSIIRSALEVNPFFTISALLAKHARGHTAQRRGYSFAERPLISTQPWRPSVSNRGEVDAVDTTTYFETRSRPTL